MDGDVSLNETDNDNFIYVKIELPEDSVIEPVYNNNSEHTLYLEPRYSQQLLTGADDENSYQSSTKSKKKLSAKRRSKGKLKDASTSVPVNGSIQSDLGRRRSTRVTTKVNYLPVKEESISDNDDDSEVDSIVQTNVNAQTPSVTEPSHPFKCLYCFQTFASHFNYQQHINQIHADLPTRYQCPQCPAYFSARSNLVSHLKIHSVPNSTTFACSFCSQFYATLSDLQQHLLSHGPGKADQCSPAPLAPPSLPTQLKPHRCPICAATFTCKGDLSRHNRKHLDVVQPKAIVRPFPCPNCTKTFRTASNLKQHAETHTDANGSRKRHVCTLCDKAFTSSFGLRYHLTGHSKERPFACTICGKTFKQKITCTVHEQIHNPERPRTHHCTQCEQAFVTKRQLEVHQFTHGGERPHKCDDCGKGFIVQVHLRNHQRIHERKGTFTEQCDDCGLKLTNRKALLRHQRLSCTKKKQTNEN